MKLSLGCGNKLLKGYVNLDKFNYYKCDVTNDLVKISLSFKNDSVNEILLSHFLEYIGQQPDTFINIIKELYRIYTNNVLIIIVIYTYKSSRTYCLVSSNNEHINYIIYFKNFKKELTKQVQHLQKNYNYSRDSLLYL